jgi:hypothetical protein
MAFLDQVNSGPGVQLLSSQIAFIAPKNLEGWAHLALGLRCSRPLKPALSFPSTLHFIGYLLKDPPITNSAIYQYLQEVVSYIVKRDFWNPRLAYLSDLHPGNVSVMDLGAAGVYINRVKVSANEGLGSPSRIGYILTPKHKDSSYNSYYNYYGWILVSYY